MKANKWKKYLYAQQKYVYICFLSKVLKLYQLNLKSW